jgi:hypothetical protein
MVGQGVERAYQVVHPSQLLSKITSSPALAASASREVWSAVGEGPGDEEWSGMKVGVVRSTRGSNDKWVLSDGRWGSPKGSLRSVLVEWVRAPNNLFFSKSSSGTTLVMKAVNLDPGTPVNS